MSFALDRAITRARDALTRERKARFRLKDILVEEVSLVDRAANKRRFLLVKRDGDSGTADVSKLLPTAEMNFDELRAVREARSQHFGIEVLYNGAGLKFSSGSPTELAKYGDPVNLKFPIESAESARNARVRVKQFAGRYTQTKSRRVVHTRIVEAELEHGVKPEIDPRDPLDKLLPAALRERAAKQKGDSMILSAKVRDALAKSVADHIERVITFAKALREAEVSDESDDKFLPAEMGDELATIARELGEPISQFVKPSEKKEGTVSAMLGELASVAMALSDQAQGEEELSGDTVAKVQRLSTLLDSLIERYPRPTAKAGEDDVNKTKDGKASDSAADDVKKRRRAATNDDITAIADAAKGLKDASKLLAGLADKLKGAVAGEPSKKDDAAGTAGTDDDDKGGDTPPIPDLAAMMGKLTEAVTTLVEQNKSKDGEPAKAGASGDSDKDGDAGNKADDKDDDAVEKRLAALEEENKRLRNDVSKAIDDPPRRASGTGQGDNKTSGEQRLFPQVYGDPIHDPPPAGQA